MSSTDSPRREFKTIGVLGGVGPQATMDFEHRLHRAAQHLIEPNGNSGYPPLFVCYLRHPPILVREDNSPVLPMQPNPGLFSRARELGAVSDFLVITSNGAHLYTKQIEEAAGKPVLSMIDLTLAEVKLRGWAKVGLLTMGEPIIYSRPLRAMNIATEALDADDREKQNAAILRLMEGRDNDETLAITRRSVQILRERGVVGIILGCTELPLLLHPEDLTAGDLLDPLDLLAEAAVIRAMQ